MRTQEVSLFQAMGWRELGPKPVERDLDEQPQLQWTYTERAARFAALGDNMHAQQMTAKAAEHATKLAQVHARS